MADDWTRAADLKAQALRLWERGDIVRATLPGGSAGKRSGTDPGRGIDAVTGSRAGPQTELAVGANGEPDAEPAAVPAMTFPYRLRLRRPRSRDLAMRFAAVRTWVREIESLSHVRMERRTVRHAELGTNTLPESVWLDDAESAAAFAGRAVALARCRELIGRLLAHDARLLDWVRHRPLALLDVADELERLLAVHDHMRARTRPGIHLREIDVAGVDGKFVEGRRELLAEWLDATLPAHAIDRTHKGVRGFARRYGYRDKPVRIRLRSLDPTRGLVAPLGSVSDEPASVDSLALADLTLDATSAAFLRPAHARVVVTENEVNFLTLPPLAGTLALFGSGYGFAELGTLDWLAERDVLYWGDIDTHGFAILDELRGVLPAVRSVLMDRETLLAHRPLWGAEPKPRRGHLPRLNAAESRLYAELVDDVHGERLRLEQERIGHGWATVRLRAAVATERARSETGAR